MPRQYLPQPDGGVCDEDLVRQAGLEGQFQIASAATSTEELGNPVYPPARRKLWEHGIRCEGKRARQMTAGDYKEYDLLIAWMRPTSATCAASVGETPKASSICCWTTPIARARWQTPGTPGILRPLGEMSWQAAKPAGGGTRLKELRRQPGLRGGRPGGGFLLFCPLHFRGGNGVGGAC